MTEYAITLSTTRPPDEVFGLLREQERFPDFSADILAVEAAGKDLHKYVLAFREGVARWTQSAEIGPRHLGFEQTDGDFVSFGGSWSVSGEPGGSSVTYRVTFRTSVPQLAGAIDPMIARVLLRAAADVVTGLAGPAEILTGGEALRDPVWPQ
ncbi:SRPBCC family protein [Amycolatopsis sp. NPDC051071]|uniref:SRPBCC family protein n=1 Tax=Amycolatopsis sp. NPDC051071 TaxID=3154637 RepID=UPI0034189A3E